MAVILHSPLFSELSSNYLRKVCCTEGVHFDLLTFFLWTHDYFYFCYKYTANNAEIQEKTCK